MSPDAPPSPASVLASCPQRVDVGGDAVVGPQTQPASPCDGEPYLRRSQVSIPSSLQLDPFRAEVVEEADASTRPWTVCSATHSARSSSSPSSSASGWVSTGRCARAGPATSADFAARTGTAERYVREWLEHHAASGLLEVDDSAARQLQRRYRR